MITKTRSRTVRSKGFAYKNLNGSINLFSSPNPPKKSSLSQSEKIERRSKIAERSLKSILIVKWSQASLSQVQKMPEFYDRDRLVKTFSDILLRSNQTAALAISDRIRDHLGMLAINGCMVFEFNLLFIWLQFYHSFQSIKLAIYIHLGKRVSFARSHGGRLAEMMYNRLIILFLPLNGISNTMLNCLIRPVCTHKTSNKNTRIAR